MAFFLMITDNFFCLYLAVKLNLSQMGNFLRFCSIVSIIIAAIKLAIMGNLSPGTVMFIIVAALLILIGNLTIYIITAAIAALVLFLKVNGAGDTAVESSLLQSILTLAFVLFGLYIMLKGVLPRRRNLRQSRRK